MLPVGGVRDKVLAARRGGIRHILLPARNRGDLEELPREAAEGLRFTFVDNIADVLFALFPADAEEERVDMSPPPPSSGREGDEAGGVSGGARSAGFHGGHAGGAGAPLVQHRRRHQHERQRWPAAGRGGPGEGQGGRERGERGGVGWEAEYVSAEQLESFL